MMTTIRAAYSTAKSFTQPMIFTSMLKVFSSILSVIKITNIVVPISSAFIATSHATWPSTSPNL